MSQEEPGEAKRSQEEPGGARRSQDELGAPVIRTSGAKPPIFPYIPLRFPPRFPKPSATKKFNCGAYPVQFHQRDTVVWNVHVTYSYDGWIAVGAANSKATAANNRQLLVAVAAAYSSATAANNRHFAATIANSVGGCCSRCSSTIVPMGF